MDLHIELAQAAEIRLLITRPVVLKAAQAAPGHGLEMQILRPLSPTQDPWAENLESVNQSPPHSSTPSEPGVAYTDETTGENNILVAFFL